MSPQRILVCGSRSWQGHAAEDAMRRILPPWLVHVNPTLIHGDAHGADRIAAQIARECAVDRVLSYPADWGKHGKAAGPIRNQRMLEEGKPDLVLAFIDKPLAKSRGTADMVRRARKAGVPVYVVERMADG
jgi:hypothetical protein